MYKSFTQMPLWKKSLELSTDVYQLTIDLPRSEDYGLASQIRRSSNSISGNIAEGFGRNTNKDKAHFYIIARGSAMETQNHLLYGNKIKYFDDTVTKKLVKEYSDLIHDINKLIKAMR